MGHHDSLLSPEDQSLSNRAADAAFRASAEHRVAAWQMALVVFPGEGQRLERTCIYGAYLLLVADGAAYPTSQECREQGLRLAEIHDRHLAAVAERARADAVG